MNQTFEKQDIQCCFIWACGVLYNLQLPLHTHTAFFGSLGLCEAGGQGLLSCFSSELNAEVLIKVIHLVKQQKLH